MTPAAFNKVLIVTDASLRLERSARAASLQNWLTAWGAFVKSVAVLRVRPCNGTIGNTGGIGDISGISGSSERHSNDWSQEDQSHQGVKCSDGELHTVDCK